MFFGGNKKGITKIIVALIAVVFIFGNFNFVEAQNDISQKTARIKELKENIEKFEAEAKECYSDSNGNFLGLNNATIEDATSESCRTPEVYQRGLNSYRQELVTLGADLTNRGYNEDGTEIKDDDGCRITDIGCQMTNVLKRYFESATQIIISIVGVVLRGSGLMLNAVIEHTVLNMADFVNNDEGIKTAWLIFRDLINILFIFGILYIAIKTIVSGLESGTRKLLANIILAALLINFSFFFTSVAIDASNFLTIEIYNQLDECTGEISAEEQASLQTAGQSADESIGIAGCFIGKLGLTTTLDNKKEGIAKDIFPTPPGESKDDLFKVIRESLVGAIMGSVFLLITSFVFISFAIMLIIRFALLIILLMTSPVMFLGWVLPKFSGITSKWIKALTDNLLWVPISFLFLLITVAIMDSISLSGTSFFSNVTNYALITVFMIASIMIAKNMGAAGASMANKVAGAATFGAVGIAGRNTIGRAATRMAGGIKGNGVISRTGRNVLKSVGNTSFDARNAKPFSGVATAMGISGQGQKQGFSSLEKKRLEDREKNIKDAGKPTRGEALEIDRNYQKLEARPDYQASKKAMSDSKEAITTSKEGIKTAKAEMKRLKEEGKKDSNEYKSAQNVIKTQERKVKEEERKIKSEQTKIDDMKEMKAIKKREDKIKKRQEKVVRNWGESWIDGAATEASAKFRAQKRKDESKSPEQKNTDVILDKINELEKKTGENNK